MELYLRWLDKYERRPGEEAPIGLILCAGKKDEPIELLELGQKLHGAIKRARKRLEIQEDSIPAVCELLR